MDFNSSGPLKDALKAWVSVLGQTNVVTCGEQLKQAATATFTSKTQVLALLKPGTTQQVSQVLKVAGQYNVKVYPVSKGKNWGLGSKVPPKNAVLISLDAMNRILAFNEELGYVRVEPGVSFKQLEAFLNERQSGLMMDSIGSTPDASLIGNMAERGHGMGLLADRAQHVCGLTVVLATGQVVHTGFQNFEHTKVAALQRWGLGPHIDGLFTQSSMGIITAMTFWLRKKSPFYQGFTFELGTDQDLGRAVHAITQARLSGLQLAIRIFNDVRFFSFNGPYPWHLTQQTPLPDAIRQQLRKEQNIQGKWVALGALYSYSALHQQAERAFLQEALGSQVPVSFYDGTNANTQSMWHQLLYQHSTLRGGTTQKAINMCYWRKKGPLPPHKDIHADNCGVLWYCPTVPATNADVQKAVGFIEATCFEHGFEPNVGLLFITERAVELTGALCYDRAIAGQDESAMACHHAIMEGLQSMGYSPYRLGIQSMHMYEGRDQGSKDLLNSIYKAIDPQAILAPGRYA